MDSRSRELERFLNGCSVVEALAPNGETFTFYPYAISDISDIKQDIIDYACTLPIKRECDPDVDDCFDPIFENYTDEEYSHLNRDCDVDAFSDGFCSPFVALCHATKGKVPIKEIKIERLI